MLCDNLDIINYLLIYFLFDIQGRQKCLNIDPYEGRVQMEFNGGKNYVLALYLISFFIDNI